MRLFLLALQNLLRYKLNLYLLNQNLEFSYIYTRLFSRVFKKLFLDIFEASFTLPFSEKDIISLPLSSQLNIIFILQDLYSVSESSIIAAIANGSAKSILCSLYLIL